MIKTNITDGTRNQYRAQVTDENALKVATVEYERLLADLKFFSNETYGIDMNRNFSNDAAGNANELIHNGTDTIAWTGSEIVGTWDFASTNNPDSGTKNIEMLLASIGDTAQFDRGSDVTMVNHTGFTGRIYITTIGQALANLDFYAWDTGTGTIVGNSVDIYNYVNTLVLGVYQSFTIPLADMGLTGATFDAVRMEVSNKAGAIFDLDNIFLTDPTGSAAIGATEFTVYPDQGSRLFVDAFQWVMAGPHAGTVLNGTMPDLPYDGFLSVPQLSSPIVFRAWNNDVVVFTGVIQQMADLMNFGGAQVTGNGSDGTNSWFSVRMQLAAPLLLNDDQSDRLTLTLSDDLSGLLLFRVSANCRF